MANTIQEMLGATPSQQPIQYMETVDAYNKWAEVYDTDGNFLQGLDTIEMRSLLPLFLAKVTNAQQPVRIIDLGCGTGRNTLPLLSMTSPDTKIIGLDASPGMLEVARGALDRARNGGSDSRITLGIFDLRQSPPVPPECALDAAGAISTLVLEHIPLKEFFDGASAVLRAGGLLLVTNMHSDMGMISQAGFVDVASGTKIRPTSYCHRPGDVVDAAEKAGFQVEGFEGGEKIRERMVDEGLVEVLGKRARKWVGIKVWFAICFRKKA